MEDLGEEVVIDTETKCISTKDDSDLYYTRSCGRSYGPVTADRDAVDMFLNYSKHTCFQIPSKSYTTGWIGSCLCDLSRRHIKSPCAAKVVLSTVESTHGISDIVGFTVSQTHWNLHFMVEAKGAHDKLRVLDR